MTTYPEAIDEIFRTLKEAWDAETTAICGYIPEIRWWGVEVPETPSADLFWCRLSQQTVSDSQATLRNGNFGQRFTNTGLVFVQIFCPKSNSNSAEFGRELGVVARNAYRTNSVNGNIWFKDSKIVEISPELKYNRFNVSCNYQYDEQD